MTEIKARRSRKKKMHTLRSRYADATTATEREKILEKAARIAPWISMDEFKKMAKGS